MKLNRKNYDLLLASRCLSVKELSEKSSVNVITLGNLRTGSVGRPKTIGKIAKALNVNVIELIEE